MHRILWLNITLVLSCLLVSASTLANQSISVDIGTNISRNDHEPMDFYRLGYHWDWQQRWYEDGNWFVSARNALSFIRVVSDVEVVRRHADSSLSGVSFTPIFRLERVSYANGFAPFIELGIGIAYFSASRIQSQSHWFRDYGSHFQFEDKLAVGVIYHQQAALALNFSHYSNLDFSPPNEGMDLVSLSFAYRF